LSGASLPPLLFAALYLGLLAFRSALALLAVRREQRGKAGGAGAGDGSAEGRVAVLQAVLGGDPRLGEVLEWNVRELGRARFYWLVDDDDPEGSRVCREVAVRHPGRVEVLSFPPPPERKNPKLYKLEGARAAAREEFLLVLDDDTRMPAPTLAALLRALEPSEPGRGSGLDDGAGRSPTLRPATGAALATSLPGYLDDGQIGRAHV
jgi:ceramide glucosyltransferase